MSLPSILSRFTSQVMTCYNIENLRRAEQCQKQVFEKCVQYTQLVSYRITIIGPGHTPYITPDSKMLYNWGELVKCIRCSCLTRWYGESLQGFGYYYSMVTQGIRIIKKPKKYHRRHFPLIVTFWFTDVGQVLASLGKKM